MFVNLNNFMILALEQKNLPDIPWKNSETITAINRERKLQTESSICSYSPFSALIKHFLALPISKYIIFL